ncbi:MAG: oligosaccharide flippase family protein [Bacteroidales bacterium]|jgi:O-antigen/teichoic acid export membrane protein
MHNGILKSEFAKNISKLVAGAAIAQAIPFFVAPVLTRIYSPSDFGFFSIFMSIAAGITVICTARYDLAIVLPKNNDDAQKLIALSFFICLFVSFFSFILITIIMFFENIPIYFFLVPLFVFTIGFNQIFMYWNNRIKQYKQISSNRINNAIYGNASMLGLGFLKTGIIGLIIGTYIGVIISTFVFVRKDLKQLFKNIRAFKYSEIKKIAIHYKDMPKTNIIQAVIDMYQLNGLVYLIPFFFSSTILGLYSFGMRILQAPVSLIGSSIAQVFYQNASEKYNNNENIYSLVKGTVKKAAIIALPLPILLLFAGEDLFAFVFSEKWRVAGLYAKILSPWIYFDFIRMTISQTPIILNKQKQLASISVFGSLIITLSVLYAGIIEKNIIIGFYSISILFSLLNIFIIYWICIITKRNLKTKN